LLVFVLGNIMKLKFFFTLMLSFPVFLILTSTTYASCEQCKQILQQNGVNILATGGCQNLPAVASSSLLHCCTQQCISQMTSIQNVNNSWGNAPDQFGLQSGREIETVGPHTFYLDAKGSQYVVDSINKQIKVLDEKNKLVKNIEFEGNAIDILVDKEENIFILDNYSFSVLNTNGTRETYALSDEILPVEGYGQGFWQDKQQNLYVCKQQYCYQLAARTSNQIQVLSVNAQADSVVPGYPLDKNQFIRTEWRDNQQAIAQILNHDWQVIQEFVMTTNDIFGAIQFIQQDDAGNFYFEVEQITKDNKVDLYLQQYNLQGEKVAEQKYANDYYSTVYKRIVVDRKGSIRQLFTTPKGVRFVEKSIQVQAPVKSNIQAQDCEKNKYRVVKAVNHSISHQSNNIGSQHAEQATFSLTYTYNPDYLDSPYPSSNLIPPMWGGVVDIYDMLDSIIMESIGCTFNGVQNIKIKHGAQNKTHHISSVDYSYSAKKVSQITYRFSDATGNMSNSVQYNGGNIVKVNYKAPKHLPFAGGTLHLSYSKGKISTKFITHNHANIELNYFYMQNKITRIDYKHKLDKDRAIQAEINIEYKDNLVTFKGKSAYYANSSIKFSQDDYEGKVIIYRENSRIKKTTYNYTKKPNNSNVIHPNMMGESNYTRTAEFLWEEIQ